MREITEIIVHCTATPEGRFMSVEEIDRWHRDRGWKGIGYHQVVYLDGSVHQGRPDAEVGAHVTGRNAKTLGLVYVGGCDVRMDPKDTRTPAQKAALLRVIEGWLRQYPTIKMISGHHDYAAKACPSFPARREYAHLLSGVRGAIPSPATPNEMPTIGTGTTTASSLNLRRDPAEDGTKIGGIPRGTVVAIYGGDGDWLNVSTPAGARGWVARRYVETEQTEEPEAVQSPADDLRDLLERALELVPAA